MDDDHTMKSNINIERERERERHKHKHKDIHTLDNKWINMQFINYKNY